MDFTNLLNSVPANSQPVYNQSYLTTGFYTDKFTSVLHSIQTSHVFSIIYLFSYILSLFGITIIIYSVVRLLEIQKDEHHHLQHEIHEAMAHQEERASEGRNERWDHIMNLLDSPNSSDWRLAIIEADTILEGLLQARDIPGNSIGEMLKNISPGDLGSMQAAWEAHLVRNRIAHEGLDYDLTQRDARRTAQLYEVVFRELGYLK